MTAKRYAITQKRVAIEDPNGGAWVLYEEHREVELERQRLERELAEMTAARDVLSKAADDTLARLKAEAEKHERIMTSVTELHEAFRQTRAERDRLAKMVKDATFFLRHSEGAPFDKLRDYADDALTALTPELDGDTLDAALADDA